MLRYTTATLPLYYAPALRDALTDLDVGELVARGDGVTSGRHRVPNAAHSVIEQIRAAQQGWVLTQRMLRQQRGARHGDELFALVAPLAAAAAAAAPGAQLACSVFRRALAAEVQGYGDDAAAAGHDDVSGDDGVLSSSRAVRWRAEASAQQRVSRARGRPTGVLRATSVDTVVSPRAPRPGAGDGAGDGAAARRRQRLGLTAAIASRHCLSAARMGDIKLYLEEQLAARPTAARAYRDAVRCAISDSDKQFRGRMLPPRRPKKRRKRAGSWGSETAGEIGAGGVPSALVLPQVDEMATLVAAQESEAGPAATLAIVRSARLVAATAAVERGLAHWREAIALLRRAANEDSEARLRRCAAALHEADPALARSLVRRAAQLGRAAPLVIAGSGGH